MPSGALWAGKSYSGAMARASSDRERARIWYQLGATHAEEERWVDALEAFESAAKTIGPEGRRSSALYRAAECLLRLNRIQDARARLEEILREIG